MDLLLILLCWIIFVKSQLIVEIIYSPYTNKHLVLNITVMLENNFQGQFEFYLNYVETFENVFQNTYTPDIIFDLTFSTSLSKSIKRLAEEKHFIIASINRPYDTYSNWEFFTHNSWQNQLEVLSSIISYFNWETFIAISDEVYNENDEFFTYFSNKNCQWFFFSNNNDKNSSDLFIGKVIQATGIKNIVILNRGESTELLLKSLEEQSLLSFGTGIIVGSQGAWGSYGNGVISYAEEGLENADSYYSYEGLALIKFLKMMTSFSSKPEPYELLECLNKKTVKHHPIANFMLLNTADSANIVAGNIFNSNLTIWNPLNYPGGSPIIPNSPVTNVNIWIASGTTNPGSYPNIAVQSVAKGEFFALSYWKRIHALDGFEITVTNTDCGATQFDPTYGYVCFYNLLATPGVGFLVTPYPNVNLGYIYTLRALNYSIPQISQVSPFANLENQKDFPEFMRVTKSDKFNIQVIFNLAVIFGWKHILVLYDDSSIDNYQYFLSLAEKYNMKIVNSLELRKIDTFYTRDDYPKWKWWFEGIVKLKTRLIFPLLIPPYAFYVTEGLYDAGMRRGDAIFLVQSRIAYSMWWESDTSQIQKLIDLFIGGIIAVQAEWIGEYGQMLLNRYVQEYDWGWEFRCLAFDSAMLLLNGIKFTILQGQNTKDYNTMNGNLRKQRFIGCSGTVSIEQGTNQRSLPTIGIYNLKYSDAIKGLHEELVGYYDLGSAQPISLFSEIIWYDNSTVVPTDLIIYENGCPFRKKQISRSENGAGVFYAIAIAFVVYTAIGSFLIWNALWKDVKIEELKISATVQFEDYILMVVVAIDFFQFISQGPDIGWLFFWQSRLCSYSMFNFESSVSKGDYWIYLYTAMIISCYWVFSACILVFKLNKLDSWLLRHTRNFAELLLPIIGNIAFVPIVSVLLSIFQCDEGISSNISDSFIKHDCTTYCWNNEYILWAIFSLISLTIYIPLSIYFKYNYEIINSHINIRTKPIFILQKSFLQVIIIAMSQTVKVYSQSLHGLFCCVLFVIFLLFCFKERPYNYGRINLWLVISYVAVLWNFILSSIYWLTKFDNQKLWIALQISVWIILILGGILIQTKLIPGLLLTAEPPDIATFFRFSIGTKISAEHINKLKREIAGNKDLVEEKLPNFDYKSYVSIEMADMVSE